MTVDYLVHLQFDVVDLHQGVHRYKGDAASPMVDRTVVGRLAGDDNSHADVDIALGDLEAVLQDILDYVENMVVAAEVENLNMVHVAALAMAE